MISPPRCEGCGKPATCVCSGLDVPMLYFCAPCGRRHELDNVCDGTLTHFNDPKHLKVVYQEPKE